MTIPIVVFLCLASAERNGHNYDEVTFEEFISLEKIDISKIKCSKCNENNKANIKEIKINQEIRYLPMF